MTAQPLTKFSKKDKIKMIGQKFGRLTVLEDAGKQKNHRRFKRQCTCGNTKTIAMCDLRNGHTQSCGCLQKEIVTKHGMSRASEYNIWKNILQRCNNHNDTTYRYYGGRGIKVCDQWLEFENFYADMGKRPKNLTIERINNDLGYSKDNCKWATRSNQQRNKRLQKTNRTGISGVYWDKKYQKFCVCIIVENKRIHIGYFAALKQAALARRQAERKYWV